MIKGKYFHLYKCSPCNLRFAVDQAYDEQDNIGCPSCGNENIEDAGNGVMSERVDHHT